jgi:lactate permease
LKKGILVFHQIYDPVNGSLGLSTVFAVLPLLTVFLLLGVLKMRAQWAALIALAVAIKGSPSSKPQPSHW